MKIAGSRGFSLLEAVISVAVFAVLSTLVFVFFRSAVDHFKVGTSRVDLQSEARRVTALLRKELSRSTPTSVAVKASTLTVAGQTVSRDRISFATLSDWNDGGNFDGTSGLPIWDRQMMFGADPAVPLGTFGYSVIQPAGDAELPWSGLAAAAIPALTGPEILRWTSLSQSVNWFSVQRVDDAFHFDLRLEGKSLDSTRRVETLQLKFELTPYNP